MKRQKKQAFIPQELQEQILVRLPVKSAIRFKSVCKAWDCMIQSPSFRDSYSRRHRHDYFNQLVYSPYKADRKFFMHKSICPSTIDMIKLVPGPSDLLLPRKMTRLNKLRDDFADDSVLWRRTVRVLGPLSNGVYLVTNLYKATGISIFTGKLALCNPATRDYKFVSAFPYHDSAYSQISNPRGRKQFRVQYGFGTTRDAMDYKVVVIIRWGPRFSSFLSFVYSLKSGAWRKLVDYENGKRDYRDANARELGLHYPEIGPDLELCPQRFLHGCWHWMVIRSTGMCAIMSFDCTHDSFKLLDPPPYNQYIRDDPCHTSGVVVLNDHLAAIFFPSPCSRIHIWMMMDYGVKESWTKIYAIEPNFNGLFTRLIGISISLQDLHDDSGYGIQTIFFEDSRNRLISCDAFGYKKHCLYDVSSAISWNTLGISSYIETVEPL